MPVRLLQVTALAAFFCASGAHAGDGFDSFMGKVVGNSTTVSYGTGGTPLVTSSANLGTPHTYGGVGIDTASPTVKGNVTVPLGNTGKSVEVAAKAAVPRASIAKGLIGLAKLGRLTPGGILTGIAIDAMIGYGIKKINFGDDGSVTGTVQQDGQNFGDKYYWLGIGSPSPGSVYPTAELACTAFAGNYSGNEKYRNISSRVASGKCYVDYEAKQLSGQWVSSGVDVIVQWGTNTCTSGTVPNGQQCVPANEKTLTEQELSDWLASRTSGWPTSSAIALQAMLKYPDTRQILTPFPQNGVEINGPTSVSGKTTTATESVKLAPGTNTVVAPGTTTATDPGTKTTTTTQSHKLTYDGNSVSYSTVINTISNVTNNTTNVTTTESNKVEETKDDAKEEESKDECEKHPERISCKEIEFDTPEGEIPRKQIDVSWSPVDLGLGGGSCPAPVQLYDNKQFSYQLACDNLLLIKTMVIAIALFVGGMIIFGGRADQ